ncbi:hypothetical protein T03_13435 [Trichinella britovi]|uniref:Uncharacterized protein n=1 Tax=Trichinella britovi TaxID=45882 RepID=A0A0V1DFL4_TRIBR|nr:hypothetical protein T03_13435 [Trichinella britovi]
MSNLFMHIISSLESARSTLIHTTCIRWRSEATPTGELGGQEKPDWLGGQQPDERGIDEKVLVTKKPE